MNEALQKTITVIAIVCSLFACGGGNVPPAANIYQLSLAFERIGGVTLDNVQVDVTVRENGLLKAGIAPDLQISAPKGQTGSASEISPGRYRFTITPGDTGEYPVSVSYQGVGVSETALVFSEVDSAWGQPMSVSGLVNTEGYEDGATITPDGEYLFVQYGPFYFSAGFLFELPRANGGCGGNRLEHPVGTPNRCTHPWIDQTIGPYVAPERPGFFDGRFSGATMLHNANSWGVGIEQGPIFAPSTMFYGFKRQADGSFREPFYAAFEDENDALINPGGLSFLQHTDGSATLLFFMDDADPSGSADINGDGSVIVDSRHDIYTLEIDFGQNINLGAYVASGIAGTPPLRTSFFPSQLVGFDKTGVKGIAGTQGNPHLYAENGLVKSIWTDDERDDPASGAADLDGDFGDIAVYMHDSGVFPGGIWSKLLLPQNVNQPQPSNEIQPFFTGTGLYFARNNASEPPAIFYSAYSGTHTGIDLVNNANWNIPRKILSVSVADTIGQVRAIGEPTIANYLGTEYLYFVYAVIRDFDATSGLADLNMQVGYVKHR